MTFVKYFKWYQRKIYFGSRSKKLAQLMITFFVSLRITAHKINQFIRTVSKCGLASKCHNICLFNVTLPTLTRPHRIFQKHFHLFGIRLSWVSCETQLVPSLLLVWLELVKCDLNELLGCDSLSQLLMQMAWHTWDSLCEQSISQIYLIMGCSLSTKKLSQ